MAKQKATITLDPYLWEQFKNDTNSSSQVIEDLIKTYLNTSGNKVPELHERKEELEAELQDIDTQREKLDKRENRIKSELEKIQSAIKSANRMEDRLDEAVEALQDKVMQKKRKLSCDLDEAVKNVKSSREFHQWVESIDCDSEKLAEQLKEEVKA